MFRSALVIGGAGMLDAAILFAQAVSEFDPVTKGVASVVSIGLSTFLALYFLMRVQPRWEDRLDAKDAKADAEREKFYADAKAEREAQSTRHAAERAEHLRALAELTNLTRALHADLTRGAGCKQAERA